jgi:CubicO group peptidase (beta-lactamase class C family)
LANEEMWARLKNVTLVNPPGFIPQYSNVGFAVLGHVLEEILDVEWGDLIRNEILTPLGMRNTGTNCSDENFMRGRAIGYTTGNSEANLMQIGWESPAGSMYSSTNDMAKFVSLFFRDNVPYMRGTDQILDALSLREWRQPRYINIDLSGYGLPWEIFQSPILYTKGGSIGGYLSLTVTIPQLKLGMVVLQSSDASLTFSEVFRLFVESFIQPFVEILENISPPPFIPPSFSSLLGDYSIMNTTVTIAVVDTPLHPVPVLQLSNTTLPLLYFSENTFKISTTSALVSCNTQQGGMEQYIIFIPSNPPTFTIPGAFPYEYATKIA